jgi:UDP-glucose 4-epimerase
MAEAPVPRADELFHFPTTPERPAPTTSFLHPRGGIAPGEKVLITGISGGQGRLIATRVGAAHPVSGVDREGWPGHPPSVTLHVVDIRKRKFEDVIRLERPDAIVHHGFVRHFRGSGRLRHEVNVLGTRRLLEYVAAFDVKRLVVLSSGYVYGALPENPTFIDEDAPLNVTRNYPEIRDLAEVDHLVTAFLWQHPEVATTILRPVNVLGRSVHTAIGRYMGQRVVPMIAGFDPMMQFIHEDDVTDAVMTALERGTHGTFNVTGPGAVPISVALAEIGTRAIPVPEPIARLVIGQLFRLGLYHTPPEAIDFLKYVCMLDGRRFRSVTGFSPRHDLPEIFASMRR